MEESAPLLDNNYSRNKSLRNNATVSMPSWYLVLSCLFSVIMYIFINSKVVRIALIFFNIIFALLVTEYEISMIVGWGALIMVLTQNVICATDRDCNGINEAFKVILEGYVYSS